MALRSISVDILLAGAAGVEPANAGTKNQCLTTWPRPITKRWHYIVNDLVALVTRAAGGVKVLFKCFNSFGVHIGG